jgi:GNAT superfamily N-acetyltransferase
MLPIHRCYDSDTILQIINVAADAYRGVIPEDCWHVPYMSPHELLADFAAGVEFWGYEIGGVLVGVMGFQAKHDLDLIRHAYILPAHQRHGIGGELLAHLRSERQILIGTWAAADWAIRFYQRHGFALVAAARKAALLKTYWTISDRQIETSVVLANPPITG